MSDVVRCGACLCDLFCHFFIFNAFATAEIYTLSLHDALPILEGLIAEGRKIIILDGQVIKVDVWVKFHPGGDKAILHRSEEHTSELQSLTNLVCRLLLEKKKKYKKAELNK